MELIDDVYTCILKQFIRRRKNKEETSIMKEDGFVKLAMIVTCSSLLLEVFGHIFISLITSLGYIFYCLE
jgi:hypothetical protein